MKAVVSAPEPAAAGRGARVLLAALLLVVGVQVSLLWIAHRPEPRRLFGDELMYWEGAGRLAAGESWSPEALWPPLQFHLLGRVLAAGGGRVGIELLQLLMLGGVALLLKSWTRKVTDCEVAGAVAGLLVLTYPPLVASAHFLWPEVLHLLLMFGALRILVDRPSRSRRLVAAGALLGLALLTKSLLLPFLPVLLLPLALQGSLRDRLVQPALVLATIVVTMAAWGFAVGDRPGRSEVATGALFNLWVGINDRSPVSLVDPVAHREILEYRRGASTVGERNRILAEKIGRRVKEVGIPTLLAEQLRRQYFRLFDRDSFFTAQLPGGAVSAAGQGYVRPPGPLATALRATSYGLYGLILVGAALGVAVVPHRGRQWLWVGLAFVGYNLAIFLLLHVKSRYRLQFLPVLMLYCGCAAAWAQARFGSAELPEGWRDRLPGWAWVLAALLLFLAFGRPLIYP